MCYTPNKLHVIFFFPWVLPVVFNFLGVPLCNFFYPYMRYTVVILQCVDLLSACFVFLYEKWNFWLTEHESPVLYNVSILKPVWYVILQTFWNGALYWQLIRNFFTNASVMSYVPRKKLFSRVTHAVITYSNMLTSVTCVVKYFIYLKNASTFTSEIHVSS